MKIPEILHVTLIGGTAGCSSGNPKFFILGNGWEYSVPRWINYAADGQVIEWNGITAEIYIKTTEEGFLDGRDPVLDFVFGDIECKYKQRFSLINRMLSGA